MFLYELKKKIKSNDKVSSIVRYFYVPVVLIKKVIFDFKVIIRKSNIIKSHKYSELERFKNIYKGKRCFIVATGPSLKVEDLEMLKNEITFSMNSIYISYDKTDWRPTYYGIQDPFVYEKIYEYIYEEDYTNIFIGSTINERFNIKSSSRTKIFPLDLLFQQIPNIKYHTKFSNDISKVVYSGYNIAYSMLQFAVYMGFKEIYLIGADCDYLQDKKYFAEDKNRGEEKYFTKKFLLSNTDKFILAYEYAKKYADKNSIKIYNATRGGKLEVFERVDFDSLF